jgi:hypothetical protein
MIKYDWLDLNFSWFPYLLCIWLRVDPLVNHWSLKSIQSSLLICEYPTLVVLSVTYHFGKWPLRYKILRSDSLSKLIQLPDLIDLTYLLTEYGSILFCMHHRYFLIEIVYTFYWDKIDSLHIFTVLTHSPLFYCMWHSPTQYLVKV